LIGFLSILSVNFLKRSRYTYTKEFAKNNSYRSIGIWQETYYTGGRYPAGKLFVKFKNTALKLRKHGMMSGIGKSSVKKKKVASKPNIGKM
jgi:hypothetical protein